MIPTIIFIYLRMLNNAVGVIGDERDDKALIEVPNMAMAVTEIWSTENAKIEATKEFFYTPTVPPTGTPINIKVEVEMPVFPTLTPVPTGVVSAPPNYSIVPDAWGVEVVPEGSSCEGAIFKLSWYWPPMGGINCDDGECEELSTGEKWRDKVGKIVAAPIEIDIGSMVEFEGKVLEVRDRGQAIKAENGYYWLDILYPSMPFPYYWGSEVQGSICRVP